MTPLLHPRRFCLLVVLSSSFVAAPSFASPTYPATLKSMLNLKTEPECTLCHANNLGGAKTVVTKFGKELMARGASGSSNVRSLSKALNSEQDDPIDSDGDGVDDFHELLDGSDPNVPDREPPPTTDPDPTGEGGSTGAAPSTASGGASNQQAKGGSAATARGGSTSSSGGAAAGPTDEPELEPPAYPEYPALQTGCSFGAKSAPSSLAGFVTLALFGLLRSRRPRRTRAQR